MIKFANFQLYTYFFLKIHQKCLSVTGLVTERVKCKVATQHQLVNECKRADQRRLSAGPD